MMKRSPYVVIVGLAAGIAALAARSGQAKQEQNMTPTITSGKQVALMADISGSVFREVNLAESEFENANMSKVKMHDINLSDVSISAANLGGAHFKHIGPAPDANGKQERQKAVTFEEAMLCDSTFDKVDLSNVKIIDCNVKGMTIDGVLVTDLIAAYKNARR
jgi:RNA polymerase sigma-70 factor (ECF subfamily)